MSQYLPYGDFAWYQGNPDVALAQLEYMRADDDVGRIYEVDISYPEHLHDEQNELPFLPHTSNPPGSNTPKLMVTLEKKIRYIVHYMNLRQAMNHGVIVDKVNNNNNNNNNKYIFFSLMFIVNTLYRFIEY